MPAKNNDKKAQTGKTSEPDYSIAKNLAKQLEDSLAKIEKGKIKSHAKNTLSLPTPMVPFQESQTPTSEINEKEAFFYHESLVKYLQHALHLPEYGNVKIALTLKPDGTVIKLEVIAAESEKNKAFLEKNLPQIKFPGFSKSDGNEQKTFLLTFCNE
jgi:colicin import membrane protein